MSNIKNQIVEEWIKLYTKELLNWCNFKINDLSQSEDLVQETFISAFENYDNFKGNSSPKTWLYKILNNKIIDFYRKNGRVELIRESMDLNDADNVANNLFDKKESWNRDSFNDTWGKSENLLDNLDFRNILALCLDDLPVNWKNAMLSKYILNRKSDEVCQELNITTSNYWQIIHRSKLLLKLCLENNWFKS